MYCRLERKKKFGIGANLISKGFICTPRESASACKISEDRSIADAVSDVRSCFPSPLHIYKDDPTTLLLPVTAPFLFCSI